MTVISGGGWFTIAWLLMEITERQMSKWIKEDNEAKCAALQGQIDEIKARVEAAQWLHDNDRSNYESERADQLRDTQLT